MSRNTKNRGTIICSSKFLLECSELNQLNLITNYLFPCLSPTSDYQFYVLSTPLCNLTLHQRAVDSIHAYLGKMCRDGAHLLPVLSETEAALQTSGKRKTKSYLSPKSCLYTPNNHQNLRALLHSPLHHLFLYFAAALRTIYCHQHETRLGEE